MLSLIGRGYFPVGVYRVHVRVSGINLNLGKIERKISLQYVYPVLREALSRVRRSWLCNNHLDDQPIAQRHVAELLYRFIMDPIETRLGCRSVLFEINN